MITNNPHLQKKRCSKKGLGRSIMRRITEIPETVSRQCSREEKDFMEHGLPKSSTLARKNPPDSTGHTKPKEESLRNRVFSLKKSHSTYDHVRDQTEDSKSLTTESVEVITAAENSLVDSDPMKKPTKKGPETAEAIATESVPLVCKSVSAHNLSADKKPLHARPSMLQKSLSVISSAKEKTLGLAGKTPTEESGKSHKAQQKGKEMSRKHSTSDKREPKDCHRKNSVPMEESKKPPHKAGIMKQQRTSQALPNTYPGADKSLSKDTVDIADVCPWEMYDQSPGAGLSDSRGQKHVSIASSESENLHPSQPKGKTYHKAEERHQLRSQKSMERYDVCPWESPGGEEVDDKRKYGNSKAQGAHGMRSENVNNKQHAANVFPGEPEEMLKKTAQTPEKDYVNKLGDPTPNASSPVGNALRSDSSRSATSSLQQPLSSRVDVCPWECETTDLPKAERSIALSNTSSLSSNKTASHQK